MAGIVGSSFIVSVRNLGYSRNAGDSSSVGSGDIGSAGGHRAMAKAVVPVDRFRQKFGDLSGTELTARIAEMAEQFLTSRRPRKEEAVLVGALPCCCNSSLYDPWRLEAANSLTAPRPWERRVQNPARQTHTMSRRRQRPNPPTARRS